MGVEHIRPDWADVLSSMPPFSSLTAHVQDLLFDALTECRYAGGDVVMRQGEEGDFLLAMLEGRASGSLRGPDRESQKFASFGPGDVVGEMALVTHAPRTATIVAETPMRALRLDADSFQTLATRHPEVAVILTHLIADRLGERSVDGLGGKEFDQYVVLRAIARGGMSVVYEALDQTDDRTVALKMMSHRLIYEPGASWRFHREAEILLNLDHPNVVRILRRFAAYKTQFIAMEYCDGPDLGQILRRDGGMPECRARMVLGQIATALSYLHGNHVIHRDLKPANVLSTTSGTLKLSDFGLAKPVTFSGGLESTKERMVIGTPIYMAPEQLTGCEIGPAVDYYALGCIGVELMTGRPLFECDSFATLMQEKLLSRVPDRASLGEGVSEEFHDMLTACLEPEPRDRRPDLDAIMTWAAPVGS